MSDTCTTIDPSSPVRTLDFRTMGISEIHGHFLSGRLSVEELAEITISRIAANQDTYKPWVCQNPELLRENARKAAQRLASGGELRPLEGIPVGVKDIYNTADFPTEMGSALWKNFTPGNDARVVFQCRESGALVPGKTVTAEFAVHALNETLNPHDVSRTPGTSSSGSAVAVALGHIPVALGSQTAGSIVRPASFCGIYGYKPSFGTIPRTGTLKTTDSLDTLGFFTALAEDLERVFDVLRVHGRNYPFVHRFLDVPDRQKKPVGEPWKVAFIKTHTWDLAPAYARTSMLDWVGDVRQAGVLVDNVDLPCSFEQCHKIHALIYNLSLAYYFEEEATSEDLISPVMRELIAKGRATSANDYNTALRTQEDLCREINGLLEGYDAVVSLSTAGSAPLRNVEETPDPALMWTLCHLPSISAPAFVCPEGRPFGVQIASRRFRDYRLLEFVRHLVGTGRLPAGPNPLLN